MCFAGPAAEAARMARQPRLDLAGIPQHIVQRGNNRLPCFLDDQDRARYRRLLCEALLASGCRLHAYVLMDNHVHLLATPPEVGAIGRMMHWLGRQYVGQFNARHGRGRRALTRSTSVARCLVSRRTVASSKRHDAARHSVLLTASRLLRTWRPFAS